MKKMILRFKRSLSMRLLLVFILTSVCIIALIITTLFFGFSSQWRSKVMPHLEQYLDYLNSDIGHPPNITKAKELAQYLPINIYINGNDINFSSTGIPLSLEGLAFHTHPRQWQDSENWFRSESDNKGQQLAFGEHHNRTVLRNQVGDYQVFYEFLHRTPSPHQDTVFSKAMLGLLSILALSYWILRRILRPVQDIKTGVKNMGQGALDYRIPVRADNDLGELTSSINNMAVEIEEMLDAKRQLLLGVSHELRSPLTRARIATQMLNESLNRARILDNLLEMENLITDILETERMNNPHTALVKTSVDLGVLIQSVLDELSIKKITLQLQPDLPTATFDETRLRLLVRNLVTNAMTHGGNATPPPRVCLSYKNHYFIINVRDHGPGIAKEDLSRVTEPFYRADPSRTRSTGGFGIGLYLCKLIAMAHGGKLTIKSALDKGTIVNVELPADTHNMLTTKRTVY